MTRLGVRPSVIGRVLNLLAEEAEWVQTSTTTAVSPDPDDEPFCACAEAAAADFVVTLNPADFPQADLKAKVIAPGDPLPGARSGRRTTAGGRGRRRGGARRR